MTEPTVTEPAVTEPAKAAPAPAAAVHLSRAAREALDADAIRALLDDFYARVRADPALGPVFGAAVADWPAHMATLTDFWCTVMLAARRYKGNPLAIHGEVATALPPGVFGDLFPLWLGLWRETTRARFTPDIAEVFITKAERIAESLKAGLLFDPARRP